MNRFFFPFALALGALLLVACTGDESDSLGQPPVFKVKVVMGVQNGKLVVLRETKLPCNNPQQRGCIESPQDQKVEAKFILRECKDNCEANWRFARIEICSGGVAPKVGRCALALEERLEFAAFKSRRGPVRIPSEHGIARVDDLAAPIVESDEDRRAREADEATNGPQLDRFEVANQNSFAREYYYLVQVCPTAGAGACQWLEDPRWTNTGRRG